MRHILLFLLLFLPLGTFAQQGKLYTAGHQLTNSFVTQVAQDRDGYIWVATRNGLNRYDGYHFKSFSREAEFGHLASNYINGMLVDRKGRLVICSNRGIERYEGGSFHPVVCVSADGRKFSPYVNSITQLRSGVIVAPTSGCGIMRLDGGDTARVVTGLPAATQCARHIAEDGEGCLWITTDEGVLLKVKGKRVVGRYFGSNGYSNSLRAITINSQGTIYVATAWQGVWAKRKTDTDFKLIDNTLGLLFSCLYASPNGRLLMGTDGTGIYVYDPTNGVVTANPYYSQAVDLTRAKVTSITEDRHGNLWFALPQKGAMCLSGGQSMFEYMGRKLGPRNVIGQNSVSKVVTDKKGNLWVGTDRDGLYLLDAHHRLIHHYTNVPTAIMAMVEDGQGRIWVGSYEEGSGWVTADSEAFHPVDIGLGDHASVYAVAPDRQGWIWFGSLGKGVVRLNPATGERQYYQMKPGAENNHAVNSIANNYISAIITSKDGRRVYVATSVGLCAYDLATKSWTSTFGRNILRYGVYLRFVTEDNNGRVLMGTNEGLCVYDPRTRKEHVLTTTDGLPDNGVASATPDKWGAIWVATDNGLARIDGKSGHIACYYLDRTMLGNEFSNGAGCLTLEGSQLVLGCTDGVAWVDTRHVAPQTWAARPAITMLTTSGREQLMTPDDDTISLSYDDNSFSLQLSTLTFDDPENTVFLYSLNNEPFTRLSPGNNEVAFSHLQPGTYKLRVKALLNNMPSEERTFVIVVGAPWYRSWWAYAAYCLLLASCMWVYVGYRRRKEADRRKMQEHIHAEEMADAKLKFFMNMSHEIRTPMTLIVSPLQQLANEDTDVYRRGIYNTVLRNAHRILSLIGQMMDLRKIDKGMLQLRMQEVDMVGFIADIFSLFQEQAKVMNVQLGYTHDSDQLPVWVDRQEFDKVLMNLLSNAFKFCRAGGHIDIDLKKVDNQCCISVSNDGATIPADKMARIFERFYQAEDRDGLRHSGTGIGLDLTQSLVEMHYGSIAVDNKADGTGVVFTVLLPLGSSHLKPEEMLVVPVEAPKAEPMIEPLELEEPSMQTPSVAELNEQLSNHGRQTIVIAEDNNEIAHYLATELGRDYDVKLAADGAEALHICLVEPPALVLTDVMMPGMDGNMLCSKLKANIMTNHIPVVMLTAKTRDEDKIEGLEMGADAYIVKPFNLEVLRRTIINLLHQRQLLRNKFNGNESQQSRVTDIELETPDSKFMDRVMDVVNAHLSNPDLSVEMIAREVGMSRVHLHRKIKELTNQTPHAFLRNLRLRKAADLLSQRGQNVADVMYACGFSNPASFSTTFKNAFGVSPSEYARRKAGEE